MDNSKFKSSREPLANEVRNEKILYKFLDKLIKAVQKNLIIFKNEYEQISNIISIFQKFKSFKPNKKVDFLQKLNKEYKKSIIYLEVAKKCKVKDNTFFDCFPFIRKKLLDIMKASL